MADFGECPKTRPPRWWVDVPMALSASIPVKRPWSLAEPCLEPGSRIGSIVWQVQLESRKRWSSVTGTLNRFVCGFCTSGFAARVFEHYLLGQLHGLGCFPDGEEFLFGELGRSGVIDDRLWIIESYSTAVLLLIVE